MDGISIFFNEKPFMFLFIDRKNQQKLKLNLPNLLHFINQLLGNGRIAIGTVDSKSTAIQCELLDIRKMLGDQRRFRCDETV